MKIKILILSSVNILFVAFSLSAQFVQVGNKLVGTGVIGGSYQGSSISLSSDGKILAVGGPLNDNGTGAVWVYSLTGSNWTQMGNKIVGNNGIGGSNQGNSVSLSSDGKLLVVGGPNDNNGIGAVWVFTFTGTNWQQFGQKLVGSGNTGNSKQGFSVDISSDGGTIAVGGIDDENRKGAVWIFTVSGNNWNQVGNKLSGTDSDIASNQGWSVSLSSDGKILAYGGTGDNSSLGAVWIFSNSGGNYIQVGNKITGSGASSGSTVFQGCSVSISSDGNSLAFGGSVDNGGTGATWVYTFSGSNWTQVGNKLVGSGAIGNAQQGASVCLSSDGKTLAVGAHRDNSNIGTSWIFTLSGGNWTQFGNKIVGKDEVGTNIYQGVAIALSSNGKTLAVGGYGDNSYVGATWFFENNGIITNTPHTNSQEEAKFEIYPNPSNNFYSITSDINYHYSIMDVHYNILETGNTSNKSIGHGLKSGIYFLNVQNKVYKVVKIE